MAPVVCVEREEVRYQRGSTSCRNADASNEMLFSGLSAVSSDFHFTHPAAVLILGPGSRSKIRNSAQKEGLDEYYYYNEGSRTLVWNIEMVSRNFSMEARISTCTFIRVVSVELAGHFYSYCTALFPTSFAISSSLYQTDAHQ